MINLIYPTRLVNRYSLFITISLMIRLPITPSTAAVRAISGGHAFISWAHPEQIGIAIESASSFVVDNGAFGAWRPGKPIHQWNEFYDWVDRVRTCLGFDFAVIPDVIDVIDVIDGSEGENDALCEEWPFPVWTGAPVWHLHDSLDRLERLVERWPSVCLGGSGKWSPPRNPGVVITDNRNPFCRL